MYHGCNVENASYGLTICAERNAIFAAVAAEGSGMRIQAVAVATERDGPCAPCGACRQVIYEFGPEALVLFRGQSGTEQMAITNCCRRAFACDQQRTRHVSCKDFTPSGSGGSPIFARTPCHSSRTRASCESSKA